MSKSAAPVNLDEFRTLPGSTATITDADLTPDPDPGHCQHRWTIEHGAFTPPWRKEPRASKSYES